MRRAVPGSSAVKSGHVCRIARRHPEVLALFGEPRRMAACTSCRTTSFEARKCAQLRMTLCFAFIPEMTSEITSTHSAVWIWLRAVGGFARPGRKLKFANVFLSAGNFAKLWQLTQDPGALPFPVLFWM
jgi:hypothetical protein